MFITESGGVHNGHPANGGAKLFREIDWRNPPEVGGGPRSSYGRGDMDAKVRFAIACRRADIKRVCITGLTQDAILRFAAGEYLPTMVGSQNAIAK
ncbi:MAG: hypothetical protein AAB699_02310 [Patescibacteria group bacterium]